jgi:hypothetical protein
MAEEFCGDIWQWRAFESVSVSDEATAKLNEWVMDLDCTLPKGHPLNEQTYHGSRIIGVRNGEPAEAVVLWTDKPTVDIPHIKE